MAKITAEFDTVEKTLVVKMDGKALDNVEGFSAYKCYGEDDEFCCNVGMMAKDDGNDMRTMTSLMASQGVKVDNKTKLQQAVAKILETAISGK